MPSVFWLVLVVVDGFVGVVWYVLVAHVMRRPEESKATPHFLNLDWSIRWLLLCGCTWLRVWHGWSGDGLHMRGGIGSVIARWGCVWGAWNMIVFIGGGWAYEWRLAKVDRFARAKWILAFWLCIHFTYK